MPERNGSLESHLENLAVQDPIHIFENNLILLLNSLLQHAPMPLLAQLEGEQVDGLSRLETEQLKRRMGLIC